MGNTKSKKKNTKPEPPSFIDQIRNEMHELLLEDEDNDNYPEPAEKQTRKRSNYELSGLYASSIKEIEQPNAMVVKTYTTTLVRNIATKGKSKQYKRLPVIKPKVKYYFPRPGSPLQFSNVTSISRKQKLEKNHYNKNLITSAEDNDNDASVPISLDKPSTSEPKVEINVHQIHFS